MKPFPVGFFVSSTKKLRRGTLLYSKKILVSKKRYAQAGEREGGRAGGRVEREGGNIAIFGHEISSHSAYKFR